MFKVAQRARSLLSGKSASTATIQTFVVKLLIISINMGTGIITARSLGAEGRGELAAIILWPQFLAFAMALGLAQSLLFNYKKYPDKKSNFFATGLVMATVLGFIAAAFGALFLPKWLSNYSTEVIRASQILMILAPVTLWEILVAVSFESEGDFTSSNYVRYSVPSITLVCLLLLLFFGIKNSIAFSLAYLLPHLPICLWMLFKLWPHYQPDFSNMWPTFRILFNYGIRSYGIDLLGAVSGKIGPALVISLLTATSMGLYSVAMSLSRMLNTFESAIITVLLPSAAARPIKEIVSLTGKAVRISTFVTVLFVVPLMVLGPYLLSILYGAEFAEAASVFRILLIEVLISGITWVLAQAFMAAGRPGVVTVLQALGLGITVPLMFFLVPIYGLNGAGLAILASTAIRFISILTCFPIILNVRPPNLIVTSTDLRHVKLVLKKG